MTLDHCEVMKMLISLPHLLLRYMKFKLVSQVPLLVKKTFMMVLHAYLTLV